MSEDIGGYGPLAIILLPILIFGTRLLSGRAVNIYVGRKRKCFVIHEALLSESCEYFKQQMGNLEEDADTKREYYLPDDDAAVFELFHTWLYSRTLKPIAKRCKERGTVFEDDHVGSTNPYFDLYFMTEARGLSTLQNLTMDRLRQYYAQENRIAGFERCDQVYQKTKPGSSLRALMVQQFLSIYFGKNKTTESVEEALRARLRMKHGEAFMVDMFETMRRKAGKNSWASQTGEGGCIFHHHELGQQCKG